MGERRDTALWSFDAAEYCIVIGLAIAWQYFRGDFFARYLSFGMGEAPGESSTLFYYCFLITLVLLAVLHPAFHERLDRLLDKPRSAALLLSASLSPLLMMLAQATGSVAGPALGCLGLAMLAFYVTVTIIAWGRLLARLEPRRIVVLVTCAFALSSALSYYMFLPQPAIIALLVALPAVSAILYHRCLFIEGPAGTQSMGESGRIKGDRSEPAFPVLLALFCIAAFSVRGLVAPLEAAAATPEFALVNAMNIAIGVGLLLLAAKARDVDAFLNLVAVALMVAFFGSLCLAIVFSSTAHYPMVNAVTLVIRACLTYALYLTACLRALRSPRGASATIGLIFLIPCAFAQALRGLLFSIDAIGAVYSTYIAPVLSLVLIVGVFLALGPRLRQAMPQIGDPQPDGALPAEGALGQDAAGEDATGMPAVPAEQSRSSAQGDLPEGFSQRYDLTPREAQIAACLSRGHTLQRTADELCISINTVRTHAKSLYRKAGIETKQQLIDLVESWGMGQERH